MFGRIVTVLRGASLPAALAGIMLSAVLAAQPAGAVDSLPWINAASAKCLDIPFGDSTNGTYVQIWTCNSNPWQQWNDPASGPKGYFLIKNAYTGKCLDISGDNPNPGAQVIEYTCNASTYENWHRVDCVSTHCKLQNEGNQNYMEPSGCGTSNGDKIYMNICRNGADVWY